VDVALPTVVPKTRTIAGEQVGRERLAVEMSTQSLADVRTMIKKITRDVTTQQIALGNPPQILEVDGHSAGNVEGVKFKTVVTYGTTLTAAAMRMVEIELRAAIARSTRVYSGRLVDVTTTWQWRFIPKGGGMRVLTSATPPPSFSQGDILTLVPIEVPYATLTNRNVARSGRLNAKPRKGKSPPKAQQNVGFLGTAARLVRRRSDFKQFSVKVEFTRAHMVPGEIMTRRQGTGVITIRARRR
jgi:hypothetical protein